MANPLPYPSNTPINPSRFTSPTSPPHFGSPSYPGGQTSPPPPPPPKPGTFSPIPGQHQHQHQRQHLPHQPTSPPFSGGPHRTDTQFSGQSYAGQQQQQQQLQQQPQQQQQQQQAHGAPVGGPRPPPPPEEQWIPEVIRDKSKPDLEALLKNHALLNALVNAPSTAHPSLAASQQPIEQQLEANVALARQVLSVESQIQTLRSSLTPSLLRITALERQFRGKQAEMDDALSPWAPKAVLTRLGQGIQEQESWCRAMEESFLEGEGDGMATDREVADWLRKYREGRKVLELRREKKCRLEESRVGGWR